MNAKKFFTSKPFIAGALAVLCVGILTACLLWQKDETADFQPEPTSSVVPVESWTENESTNTPTKEAGRNGTDNIIKEEYPKESVNSEGQTVIDFTDPEPTKPEAPPVPEGKTEITEPAPSHPVQKDPAVTPPPQETITPTQPSSENKPDTTVPDSGEKSGQIYDPVFGWITPGEAQAKPIDAGGDPNKEVGNMN